METESYRKHRPRDFKDVAGQDSAVKTLAGYLENGKFPHAILFVGPSGTGKTTLASICANVLNCSDTDFTELDCASAKKPLDAVREIRETMGLAPMIGDCRVFCLEEVQALSRAKFAQEGLLRILEKAPKHAYFMLTTTDPQKLLKTVRSRCTPITLHALEEDDLDQIIARVLKLEKAKIKDVVKQKILDLCEGNGRNALVMLDSVLQHKSTADQLDALVDSDVQKAGVEIARALLARKRWPVVAAIIRQVDEDPEALRRMILGYMSKVMLGGGKNSGFCNLIVQVFRDHWYDCGRAGLVASCYEVCTAKGSR